MAVRKRKGKKCIDVIDYIRCKNCDTVFGITGNEDEKKVLDYHCRQNTFCKLFYANVIGVETVDEVLENDIALDIAGDVDVGDIGDEVSYSSVEDEEGCASVDGSGEIDAVDSSVEIEILSNDILEIQHSVEDLAVNKSTLRMRSSRSSEVERELDLEDLLRIFQFGLDVGLSSGQGNDLLKLIIDLFAKYNANVKVNVTTWKATRQIVLRGTEKFEMKVPFTMALPELYFGTMDVDEPNVKLETINGHFFNMKYLMANIFF